jgi:hypothetical protein
MTKLNGCFNHDAKNDISRTYEWNKLMNDNAIIHLVASYTLSEAFPRDITPPLPEL